MKTVGIGETVLDIIFKNGQPQKAVPGGSTFNSIVSLGRTLGAERSDIPIMMVTRTGDDSVADVVCSFLEENHISTSAVYRKPGTKSTVSLAFLNEDNDARYQFYRDGWESPEDFCDVKFEKGDLLMLSSFFAVNPAIRDFTRKTIRAAREAGATIYYDINFRKNHIGDLPAAIANIEENCSLSDFVRGSSEDIALIYGNDDGDAVYREHISKLCRNFICTRGAGPVQIFTPEHRLSFEAPQVEAISTIGAGDSFNAGFIYGLIASGLTAPELSAEDWKKLVDTATSFSSEVCRSLDNYVPTDFLSTLK